MDDFSAWQACLPKDLWIFDKLILATRLGYTCGPKGMAPQASGQFIVRPCINLLGMGRGAYIASDVSNIEDGSFWCEAFQGRHLSVDYYKGNQMLCVEGVPLGDDLSKWAIWKKTNDTMPLPNIVKELEGAYDWINVEFIGNKIVEIHLRNNPDFEGHGADYVIPAYDIKQLAGHEFIDSPDYKRLGFFIPAHSK